IKTCSVSFNVANGILASASQSQLYQLSQKNGSSQSFYEFAGEAMINDNNTGKPVKIGSLGSMLVLNPTTDFGLSSMYSGSSGGQFNFQIKMDVYNQSDQAFNPEICVITVNSGLFITQNGVSSTQTGILTR